MYIIIDGTLSITSRWLTAFAITIEVLLVVNNNRCTNVKFQYT